MPPDMQAIIAGIERGEQRVRAQFEPTMRGRAVRLTERNDCSDTPSAAWTAVPDRGAQTILRRAVFADLILTGRPSPEDASLPASIDAALFTQALPVLLAPPVAPRRIEGPVLIAWNPTLQAEHATMRALPFLHRASRVVLFSVIDRKSTRLNSSH